MTGEIKTLFSDCAGKKRSWIISWRDGGGSARPRQVWENRAEQRQRPDPGRPAGGRWRFYWEVVRASPFVELVRKAADERKSSLAEVVLGEKNILCRASYLPSEGGVVVTFHDISEMQNLAGSKGLRPQRLP